MKAEQTVYLALQSVTLISDFIAQYGISQLLPEQNKAILTRFWAQYAFHVTMIALITSIGYIAIGCTSSKYLSWLLVIIIPAMTLYDSVITRGASNLVTATSGVGSISLMKRAIIDKRKMSQKSLNKKEENAGDAREAATAEQAN